MKSCGDRVKDGGDFGVDLQTLLVVRGGVTVIMRGERERKDEG